MKTPVIFVLTMTTTMFVGSLHAADLKQVGTIDVPGEKLTNFDISFVDQKTGMYYLADRNNKAVDIIDTKHDKFVGRIGGFVGVVMKDGKPNPDESGPDGVLFTGKEIWVGDGDSTVKIINPVTQTVVDTISTGGKTRVDEMAYDPRDRVVIVVNNAEDPPFATLISTQADHKIVGKVEFSDAGDGAEQPAYNPRDGLLYVSIPQIGKDPEKGGVAVIEPKKAVLVKMLSVDNCHPAGLAFGPNENFVLGCGADGKDDMPAVIVVMSAKTGAVVVSVPNIGGADMVDYNARNHQYYTASRSNPGGPALGVIDAATNALVQTIPINGKSPHSVSSSEATGRVYVPVGEGDSTIHVYAPSR